MELDEKQYELGGVVFGLGAHVGVESNGWQPGQASRSTQDEVIPNGDGVRVGIDRDGAATWGFTMFTNAEDEAQAWDYLNELGNVWSGDDHRGTPDAVVPLRYRVADQVRRIYGRPRRWTHTPNNLSIGGMIAIQADFNQVDPLVYEDELQTQTISLGLPADPDAGLLVPFIPPVNTAPGASGSRQDSVLIGGSCSTPITVKFFGPVANAQLAAPGWKAAMAEPVAGDNPVTIDPHSWVRAATKQGGGSARVSPRVTRISQMTLPPGRHDLIFTGLDPTGVARVEVSWRNAHRLPR